MMMHIYCCERFFGYLSGFVHCFAGYWIAFRHISGSKLGRSGTGFIEISGKRGLIGVPPSPQLHFSIRGEEKRID